MSENPDAFIVTVQNYVTYITKIKTKNYDQPSTDADIYQTSTIWWLESLLCKQLSEVKIDWTV